MYLIWFEDCYQTCNFEERKKEDAGIVIVSKVCWMHKILNECNDYVSSQLNIEQKKSSNKERASKDWKVGIISRLFWTNRSDVYNVASKDSAFKDDESWKSKENYCNCLACCVCLCQSKTLFCLLVLSVESKISSNFPFKQ